MNQDPDDKRVAAEYRAFATERTPEDLDEAVLRQARAVTSRLQEFTANWFRPLAFVATLALSLGLLLEWTGSPEFQPAEMQETEAGRVGAGLVESGKPRNEASGPVPEIGKNSDSQAAESSVSADFTDVIEATSRKVPGADSVSRNANQGLRQSQPAAQIGEIVVYGNKTAQSDAAAGSCSEEQTSDPETWWQCIAALEDAGRQDEADAELELLRMAHPDFDVPAMLPSQ